MHVPQLQLSVPAGQEFLLLSPTLLFTTILKKYCCGEERKKRTGRVDRTAFQKEVLTHPPFWFLNTVLNKDNNLPKSCFKKAVRHKSTKGC